MDRAAKRRLAGATVTSPYDGPLDFNKLYTGIDLTKYWDYSGSFTTPPCTEAVDFYIMMQPATLTQAQLDKIKALADTSYPSFLPVILVIIVMLMVIIVIIVRIHRDPTTEIIFNKFNKA